MSTNLNNLFYDCLDSDTINKLLKTKSVRSVVNLLVKETNLPKNLIYNEVLKVKENK